MLSQMAGLSHFLWLSNIPLGFPGGSAGKESTCNVGDLGLIPELGRSPGGGSSYPLQYSSLENSIDCNPPGSSVHGILQARILEWISCSYSRGSSQLRDQTHILCISCIGRRIRSTVPLGGHPPDPRIEARPPALQDFLQSEPPGSPNK